MFGRERVSRSRRAALMHEVGAVIFGVIGSGMAADIVASIDVGKSDSGSVFIETCVAGLSFILAATHLRQAEELQMLDHDQIQPGQAA